MELLDGQPGVVRNDAHHARGRGEVGNVAKATAPEVHPLQAERLQLSEGADLAAVVEPKFADSKMNSFATCWDFVHPLGG